MKWGTNVPADTNCPGGYEPTDTPQSSCKTGNACYECMDDGRGSIMKWGNNVQPDDDCPGGYQKVDKPASECPPEIHENPKTGATAIIIAWVVAIIALGYTVFYMIRISKIK